MELTFLGLLFEQYLNIADLESVVTVNLKEKSLKNTRKIMPAILDCWLNSKLKKHKKQIFKKNKINSQAIRFIGKYWINDLPERIVLIPQTCRPYLAQFYLMNQFPKTIAKVYEFFNRPSYVN